MNDQPSNLEQAIDQATAAVEVQTKELSELNAGELAGNPIALQDLLDVPVRVTVQIGRARMTLEELVRIGPGSVITLDREAHEPADILVNGKIIAQGEVVTIENTYGVRITQVHREQ